MALAERTTVIDEAGVRRALRRMAHEIVERNGGTDDLVLMGIRRRGVDLADLLRDEIQRATNVQVASGSLDITMYRDDLLAVGPRPVVGETELPPDGVDDRVVVVVDDVLFTGRTVRAALNELMDFGRPARVFLCVLVDRGGREIPIQPDIVGREVTVGAEQTVEVRVPDLDGSLAVEIVQLSTEPS